jgi:hypothetical protein
MGNLIPKWVTDAGDIVAFITQKTFTCSISYPSPADFFGAEKGVASSR